MRSRVWIVVLSLLSNALGLALPLALIQVYDRIIANQAIGTALVLFSAVLIAILLDGMVRFARSALFSRLGSEEEFRLSLNVARRVLGMRREELSRFGAGHVEELFASISRSRDVLVGQSLLAMFDAPFAVAFLALVWFLGGAVVLAPLAVVAVVGLLAFSAAIVHRRADTDLFHARAEHKTLLVAGARNAEVFRTGGLAGALMARLHGTELAVAEATERTETQTGHLMDLPQVGSIAASVAILAMGALAVLAGDMTSGGVAACLILGQRAVAGLIGIVSGLARRRTAAAAERRLRAVLGTQDAPEGLSATGVPLGLDFKDADTQFSVEPGALAIVEFQDAAAVKACFRALSDGFATGDGPVLTAADGSRVRAGATLVETMPPLFQGTILDNLSGFTPENIDRAISITNALGLDQLLARLSGGYQTPVGAEFGAPLSAGAIKRIGLIRALNGMPGLIVLENPTYALDKDGVDRLAAFLPGLGAQTTVVILARAGTLDGLPGAVRLAPGTASSGRIAA
ncbi:hypothetical protein [Roseibium sp. Sym1]|uniref:hypothetical protein n=1 Tax=Roseibium sp. Sym1 TaxID=3016006 RepID=UPI0022B3548E|nr:hypothetical protein [Roseibium sp. Sym1]